MTRGTFNHTWAAPFLPYALPSMNPGLRRLRPLSLFHIITAKSEQRIQAVYCAKSHQKKNV